MTGNPAHGFSYLLPADTIGEAQKILRIVVDEAARGAWARRFDLIAIDSLVADLTISRIADSALIRVSGSLRADIVQACVVSREPVAASIDVTISERLGPQDEGEAEMDFDIDEEDPPLPFTDDSIELGELLAQHLAISIDPYPRAVGVASPSVMKNEERNDERRSNRPFASLAILKKDDT